MLRANMRDGRTLSFDLADDKGRLEWEANQADPRFQQSITALAILHDRVLHTLPVPKRFRRIAYEATLITNGEDAAVAERIGCLADGVSVQLTVYLKASPRTTRVDVRRVGKPRWVPQGRALPVETER